MIACSSDSDTETSANNPANPSNPTTPIATEKLLVVSDSNIPSTQGELLIFVNGSGSSRVSANVKVGDIVKVQSNSTAPPSTQYYISVMIENNILVTNHTSAYGDKLVWQHTITAQDFQ